MRVTSKGQVTIPQEIRDKYGFLPQTEVTFVEEGERVYLVRLLLGFRVLYSHGRLKHATHL